MDFLLPLLGGLFIGLSAAGLLLLNGRIAGISGIFWGAMAAQGDKVWRVLFIVGLPLGALLGHIVFDIPVPLEHNNALLAVCGGLLVGVGIKLGSGCTSGHGVCGIGRLSLRSLVATCTFMATGIATVFIMGIFF